MFIILSIPQRVNLNAIFASEKLRKSYDLVNTVANMKINDIRYRLNTATTNVVQVEFTSDPDKITHTSNGITHQTLLSSRTIGT